MSENLERADVVGIERPLMLEETAPAPCPAPMPRQVIIFWTPRLAAVAALQVLKMYALRGLRHPSRTQEPATVIVRNFDET